MQAKVERKTPTDPHWVTPSKPLALPPFFSISHRLFRWLRKSFEKSYTRSPLQGETDSWLLINGMRFSSCQVKCGTIYFSSFLFAAIWSVKKVGVMWAGVWLLCPLLMLMLPTFDFGMSRRSRSAIVLVCVCICVCAPIRICICICEDFVCPARHLAVVVLGPRLAA